METYIQPSDKIITSRGRFGRVKSTDGIKSIVTIGKNDFEIFNTELSLVDNVKSVQVEFCREALYNDIEKDIIWISKKSPIYDFNKPLDNLILNECKAILCKKLNVSKIIIVKINLI